MAAHLSPTDGEQGEVDFAAEGLLDGLEGQQRSERLELLEGLYAEGVPLGELHRRNADGTILFLAAERTIGGRERYTTKEVAELTGVAEDFLVAVRRAMGLPIPSPDDPVYTEADLESVRMATVAEQAGISTEEILDLMRTLGRGLSQAAETMRALPLRLVLEPGLSERELSERYALAASQLYPMLGPLLTNLLTVHLRQMAQSELINTLERSGGQLPGARQINICFADLVGFTRLGEALAPDELGALAARLEALTIDALDPTVKLVKTIGDAVMLTSPKPEPLLDTALRLIDAAEGAGEDFPQLRAGVAGGPALSRAGDWFGRPVNLASRITQIARPGSVLAERGVHHAAAEGYRWSYLGQRRLRGLRDPVVLFRARRLSAPGPVI